MAGPAEGTKEKTEIQEEFPIDARIRRREAYCHDLLRDKEQLQLKFVYEGVPKPYYERWKAEGNEIFSQLVSLKQRRRRAAAK